MPPGPTVYVTVHVPNSPETPVSGATRKLPAEADPGTSSGTGGGSGARSEEGSRSAAASDNASDKIEIPIQTAISGAFIAVIVAEIRGKYKVAASATTRGGGDFRKRRSYYESMRTPALRKPHYLIENPQDGSVLTLIPAGTFLAGGSEYHEGHTKPFVAHLDAYYLGITPVTNRQYKLFLDATGREPPGGEELDAEVWGEPEFPEQWASHPVVNVTWYDAIAYCRWANVRLPTELEWEKGARGIDGRLFPWGSHWDRNLCQNDVTRGLDTTCGVWSHPEGTSVWGCYQMAGNVWEWCTDWFSPGAYKRYAHGDLSPPSSGRARATRGSSWFNEVDNNFHCAYRFSLEPDDRGSHYGFRVAKSAD